MNLKDLTQSEYEAMAKGFKPDSMEIINTILHSVFTLAVRDGYIRSNPTDGVMAEIRKSHNWEKPKRHALTEQEAFIDVISNSDIYRHWLPLFFRTIQILLGTLKKIVICLYKIHQRTYYNIQCPC